MKLKAHFFFDMINIRSIHLLVCLIHFRKPYFLFCFFFIDYAILRLVRFVQMSEHRMWRLKFQSKWSTLVLWLNSLEKVQCSNLYVIAISLFSTLSMYVRCIRDFMSYVHILTEYFKMMAIISTAPLCKQII